MDRLLENDTILKVVSAVVAIFLWFQVQASTTQTVNKSVAQVSVTWTTPPNARLNVMSIQPNLVTVQIKGPPKLMSGVNSHNVTAWVNLSGLTRPGTYTLHVVAPVPAGTSLVSVVPSEVVVTVDQIGSRKMTVTLRPQGTPNSADQLVSVSASTKTATLSGPTTDLNEVTQLVGEVPVAGQTANVSTQVLLLPLNASGHVVSHVQVSPPSVTADAIIQPKPPEKTVGVVARLSGHPATGYTVSSIVVSPSHVRITASSKSALSAVSSVNTVPIDITGLTSGVSESIPLALPKGVSPVGNPDVTVTVTIARTG
ncbi:MAG: CdaR family protein [Thermaerobacter sp.]|nr:CdaR family protein [Thermaerobacter sp.]